MGHEGADADSLFRARINNFFPQPFHASEAGRNLDEGDLFIAADSQPGGTVQYGPRSRRPDGEVKASCTLNPAEGGRTTLYPYTSSA